MLRTGHGSRAHLGVDHAERSAGVRLPLYVLARHVRAPRCGRPLFRERGAIAAPTAGLHFTTEILDAVAARGVEIVRITLHVGIGTFKPVKVDDVSEHRMDAEDYEISEAAAGK